MARGESVSEAIRRRTAERAERSRQGMSLYVQIAMWSGVIAVAAMLAAGLYAISGSH